MCGIAGFSGRFENHLLDKMNNIIAHRGPDDAGTFYNQEYGVGLAHRRLSIIDLSPSGHQPMWDVARRVVIIFNGEIYNFKELHQRLVKAGYSFKSKSDTEVLLNLYLEYGEYMLSHLNGMFAFALFDVDKKLLFMARDGVGVKPFYYAQIAKGFLFASELKALLLENTLDRTINYEAVHYHLTYLWCPSPHTMLKSVNKLEPGHAMLVTEGKIIKKWKFYDLPYNESIKELTVKEAEEQIWFSLNRAVERQMVADVPVGAFLSGGLDSSSVVTIARQYVRRGELQCFTIGSKDKTMQSEGMADDLPYAKRVADHLGVTLHTIYVGAEMVEQLQKMIYYLDEPLADPAPINALFISQLAREHGIKVLLSGAGGDDIFTGYRRHYALTQENKWSWIPKPGRRCIREFSNHISPSTSFRRRLSKAFRYADLDGDERIVSYFYWTSPDILYSLYSADLKKRLRDVSSAGPLLLSLSALNKDVAPINRMLYLEGKHFLADHNLNYTDKMSMAAGVEVRVPLLDSDLISLATSLPISFKQNGRIGKWIFKKTMEPYLPRDVIYRPKTGFGVPLRRWLRVELRPLVEDVLSERSLKKRALFDPEGVTALLKKDRDGRIDATYTIFSLICIELWCRDFIDSHIV